MGTHFKIKEVLSRDPLDLAQISRQTIEERLVPRLKVEEYFRRSGRTFRKSRFRLWFNRVIKARLIEIGFRAFGIYARGKRNALAPAVRHVQLFFPNLPPAFDGYQVLHLSDFHIDEIEGLVEALVPVLSGLRCDLCVLTGDYRYEITGPCDEVYPRMEKIIRNISTRHGIVGILGNHDAAEIAFKLEELGVHMLINDAVRIENGKDSLWFAGIDDQFDYRCADIDKSLRDIPSGGFKILLAHDPQHYRAAAARGVELYLCGHTHAGQIRLPILGAIKKNAPVPRQLVQGHWTQGSMQGYTSWGIGCSTLPVRYNCPPELAILELRRS